MERVGRLRDADSIVSFKNLMLKHGVLGYGLPNIPEVSEIDRFKILPMVFGFMPEAAIRNRKYDKKIIPIIRAHLEELNISYDDELLQIIKFLCDQYYSTSPNLSQGRKKKFQISDIRSNRFMHQKIFERQNGRCHICGTLFNHLNYETLDHIIPWRLIGDVQDGSNWQFLCAQCNTSKAINISYLQMPESLNWSYTSSDTDSLITNKIRYAVLCRDRRCMHIGCNGNYKNNELTVCKTSEHSSFLFEFLEARCPDHLI